MTVINAVFLGLVQGITEFFPVSSSGHLAILGSLFNMTETGGGHHLLNAMLHLGTLIALIVVLRKEIKSTFYEIGAVFNVGPMAGNQQLQLLNARQFIMICAATLPLALIVAFHSKVDVLYSNSFFVGAEFVLSGCVLYAADKINKGKKTEKNISVLDSVIVGICQCAAVIPGISRVGVVTSAGIVNGFDPEYALKFAFRLSVPALLGSVIAGFAEAFKSAVVTSEIPLYLVSMLFAVIGGIISINLMIRLFKNGKFGNFAYYCWLAGALTVILTMIF